MLTGATAGDPVELAEKILRRAASIGIELTHERAGDLADHARRVLEADPALHLTSIREEDAFLERHVGESLEGAALLETTIAGPMLDLGSGNGYPGLPVAASRSGLIPVLSEASSRKAAFLRSVLQQSFPRGRVIERQIQRAGDLADEPPFSVIVTRAMGNWERVLPRLSAAIVPDGVLLVWAGEQMRSVSRREVWRRYRLEERRVLPGRDRSWVWKFRTPSEI